MANGRPPFLDPQSVSELKDVMYKLTVQQNSPSPEKFKELVLEAARRQAERNGRNPYAVSLPCESVLKRLKKELKCRIVAKPSTHNERRLEVKFIPHHLIRIHFLRLHSIFELKSHLLLWEKPSSGKMASLSSLD